MNESVRSVLQVILLVASVLLIGQGIWLFANSRLPSWVKGVWKWPLGDNYPAAVAHLMGWASVLAGAACLPTLVLLGSWDRSTTSEIAIVIAMFFAGAASFSSAWCLFLSRTKLA
jgi:Na+(H+)/acetate symporter ActP